MKENAIMYNILWQIFKFLPDNLILSLLIIRKAIPIARNISVLFFIYDWILTRDESRELGSRPSPLSHLARGGAVWFVGT